LLAVTSRLQIYFCSRFFRKEIPIKKAKKGGVIIVGGGDGSIEKAYNTACRLLHHMNALDIGPTVFSHKTNDIPSCKDVNAIKSSKNLAKFFNADT
jgi:hypothetical protein